MESNRVVIVGGGAAGFFAAIACAEASTESEVTLLEKGSHFLTKVRISGGGRCNVTHALFDARAFSERYPRGGRSLVSALHRFDARDTVAWFERRGVRLKTESDGRMFPVTDSSATVVACLQRAAEEAGVRLQSRSGLAGVVRDETGGFRVRLANGDERICDRLLFATGGCRNAEAGALAESLGHTIVPPVPSLFTFHVEMPWLRELPGVAVEDVTASVPETGLRERGPLLVTHWGVSGPVILRLSAWGARALQAMDYRFPLHIQWLPSMSQAEIDAALQLRRATDPARLVANVPLGELSSRLWTQLVGAAGIPAGTRWTNLSRAGRLALTTLLTRTVLPVTGKSLNKEEFVTCGGVRLSEVDLKTMASRVCPGLYFAGEVLDVDGITGGFNFQAAWTTGWIAGHALAGVAPIAPTAA